MSEPKPRHEMTTKKVVLEIPGMDAVHRIFHSLHDLGLKTATGAKLTCYGAALLGTALAAYSLLAIGF